jgi:hypothetical protein
VRIKGLGQNEDHRILLSAVDSGMRRSARNTQQKLSAAVGERRRTATR